MVDTSNKLDEETGKDKDSKHKSKIAECDSYNSMQPNCTFGEQGRCCRSK